MVKTVTTHSIFRLAIACLSLSLLTDAAPAGLRSRIQNRHSRTLQEDAVPVSAAGGEMKVLTFMEAMTDSDDAVVLLEEGPFILTASCKTITYNYSEWDDIYAYTSSFYSSYSSQYSSSSRMPYSSFRNVSSSGIDTSTASSSWWSSDSTGGFSNSSWWTSDDFYYEDTHTESIAALELTYTANDTDYVFGMPSYLRYPHEDRIVGNYEAGENRTQIVFAGFDGGWYDSCTLQSMSGSYFSINGDSTIGTHKTHAMYLPGSNASFPEGVDCMMAGIITYNSQTTME